MAHHPIIRRRVSENNLREELDRLVKFRRTFRYIAIDTEFTGVVNSAPSDASEEGLYSIVKESVDNMKLLQLGITLFDYNGNTPGLCWEFNFSDISPLPSNVSIDLLRRSGHDFERNVREGISGDMCGNLLRQNLFNGDDESVYVTFHGLYDFAYVIKLITGGAPMPDNLGQFIASVRKTFGHFYDLKYIGEQLSSRTFGLMSLARELGVEAYGIHHQAAHDSVTIGRAFIEMERMCHVEGDERFVSVLNGFSNSCMDRDGENANANYGHHRFQAPRAYYGHHGYQAPHAYYGHHRYQAPRAIPPTMLALQPHAGLPFRVHDGCFPVLPFQAYGVPNLLPLHQAHGVPSSSESQHQQSTLSCHINGLRFRDGVRES
ncbi:putative CCR4-associated factor 1 homolog 8 [Musa acuminata AAA Group]|uniref:putative CCR4-associated factor 1 homolog 8 n=1 Tax=Musa acuminata AAA Group TaxID=214697 RepID=UPI0031E2E459